MLNYVQSYQIQYHIEFIHVSKLKVVILISFILLFFEKVWQTRFCS